MIPTVALREVASALPHGSKVMTTPKIAVVGTTRAGKSVFITVLAKHLERPRDGARLSPKGGSPKNTYTQIEEWWNELQAGNWLPPTPPGTLIELNWDLVMDDKTIPLQMFDYAGETLTDLFNNRARDSEGAARQYFDQVRDVFESASVLLVLLNLESLIEQGVSRATETKGTLITAMTAFLNKIKADKRDCRVCFVFTSYDRYESLITQRWGSVRAFLEQEIPPLYYEVADKNPNVQILPVAAIGETETRVEPQTGNATLYPRAGFKTKGFDQLVRWLVKATSESKADLDVIADEARQDLKNQQFLQKVRQSWEKAKHSTQLEPVDRVLVVAKRAFPHAKRPDVGELELQRNEVVSAAKQLRTMIVQEARASRAKRVGRFLKSGLLFAALVVAVGYWLQPPVAPWPRLFDKETHEFNCTKNWLYVCAEHRALARVPVYNGGAAGNVEITVSLGGRSQSVTKFLNQGEEDWVAVQLTDLPSCDQGQACEVDLRAAN